MRKTVPSNMRNAILANVISTVSINSDRKKVRYKLNFYMLHPFLLAIILLFITGCCHYTKCRSKQIRIGALPK